MKRPYETLIVYDGSLPEEVLEKEQKKIQDIISESDEFEKIDVWGRRELAYTINKKKVGVYVLFIYAGEGSIVGKIERGIHLNEAVLRHITVIRDPKAPYTKPGQPAVSFDKDRAPISDMDLNERD